MTVCFVGSTPQAVLGTIIAGMPEAVTQHKHRKTVPANIEATINKVLETVPTDGPPASSGTEIRLTGLEGKGAARGGGEMRGPSGSGRKARRITERRTKRDWAHFLEEIADQYESAEKITLVMDNLNTHVPGSLYEAFAPDKAKALWDRMARGSHALLGGLARGGAQLMWGDRLCGTGPE